MLAQTSRNVRLGSLWKRSICSQGYRLRGDGGLGVSLSLLGLLQVTAASCAPREWLVAPFLDRETLMFEGLRSREILRLLKIGGVAMLEAVAKFERVAQRAIVLHRVSLFEAKCSGQNLLRRDVFVL